MTPPRSVAGLNVAVLGLGRSGQAAARLALARGAGSVYASDAARGAELERGREELERLGAVVELGRHDPERLASADLAVVSPGIPPDALALGPLRGSRVVGEIELASWYVSAPIAAVTGTNGKTTTTALLQAMCAAAGLRSRAAGNIGLPLSDVASGGGELDWVVCEVSSFQLATIESFRPRVGLLTNVSPDHLDRYPDVAAYVADKEALARNMTADDALVVNADDPGSRGFATGAPARRHVFTTARPTRPGVGLCRGWIVQVDEHGHERRIAPVSAVRIPGPHNLQNALAASVAALLMGLAPEAVEAGLRGFTGVPHRLEEVARVDGVRFVNDSKATNVEATAWALRSVDTPVHLILGGRHKGAPYTPLLPEMAGKVRGVYAIGEARDLIATDLGREIPVYLMESLETAVMEAFRSAAGGETVLLSPACSSYDMFRDFEHRGDTFREVARSLRRSPAFIRSAGRAAAGPRPSQETGRAHG